MKKFISILAIFTMLFSLGLTAIASDETDETELTQADKYAADKIGLLSNLEERTQMSPFSINFDITIFAFSWEHDVTELNGMPLNSVD